MQDNNQNRPGDGMVQWRDEMDVHLCVSVGILELENEPYWFMCMLSRSILNRNTRQPRIHRMLYSIWVGRWINIFSFCSKWRSTELRLLLCWSHCRTSKRLLCVCVFFLGFQLMLEQSNEFSIIAHHTHRHSIGEVRI